jgi:phage shock protein PspC (stress-responsive transcriptional regulator)
MDTSSKASRRNLRIDNRAMYNTSMSTHHMKKLYRHDRHSGHGNPVVSGVFSGLGEWAEVSPGILRAGYIVLAILTGILPAIAVYIFFHMIVPKKD